MLFFPRILATAVTIRSFPLTVSPSSEIRVLALHWKRALVRPVPGLGYRLVGVRRAARNQCAQGEPRGGRRARGSAGSAVRVGSAGQRHRAAAHRELALRGVHTARGRMAVLSRGGPPGGGSHCRDRLRRRVRAADRVEAAAGGVGGRYAERMSEVGARLPPISGR